MHLLSRLSGLMWRLVAALLSLTVHMTLIVAALRSPPATPCHYRLHPLGLVIQEVSPMSLHPQRQWIVQNYPALFDGVLDRIHNSPNRDERELIFFGFADGDWLPVVAPRAEILKHSHIVGDSGSGKTSRGVIPLTSQLIAAGDVSVVIFDLKGDLHLYANARAEAERAGLPFKWFTNRIGWSSHLWNPCAEPSVAQTSHAQRAQSMLASLGIPFAEVYGSGFFSSQQRTVVKKLVQRFAPSIRSLRDLQKFLNDPNAYKGLGPRADWENARHAPSVLEMLNELKPLQATAADFPAGSKVLPNAISAHDVVTQPMVVYFWLQSPIDANQATVITRLFLFSEMNTASLYQHERPTVKVFNIVDEAQHIATQGLPQLLESCRSLELGLVLAHQSLDQLKVGAELDLTNRVMSSTAVKQVFRASDPVIRDYLIKSGGEAQFHFLQWEQPLSRFESDLSPWASTKANSFTGTPSATVQEVNGPRVEVNRLMEVSSHPYLSYVNFTQDSGPVQYQAAWTPVVSGFHIDLQTYQDRHKYARWPAASEAEGTFVVPRDWEPAPSAAPSSRPASPPLKPSGDLQERIREAQERLRRLKGDQM